MANRWEGFSDLEIYVLKRQAFDASVHIMRGSRPYDQTIKDLHTKLMNELSEEDRRRNKET
jgi:hypothetical protein